jgi:tetratricopeptide (TPR) repeat protein
MKLRPKTVKRLAVLAAVAAIGAASLAGVYYFQRQSQQARLVNLRVAGLASFDAGDFKTALPQLIEYRRAFPADTQVLLAYADARLAIEQKGGQHIVDARLALQQILRLDASHRAARLRLIDLYLKTGEFAEMLTECDTILSATPTDLPTLRNRALALEHLGRATDAVDARLAYNRANPTDIVGQVRTIEAMRMAARAPDTIVKHAQSQLDANATDPLFNLPLAVAYRYASQRDAALQALDRAAAAPQLPFELVDRIAGELDRLAAFDRSVELLRTLSVRLNDPQTTALLVQRLWQAGKYDEAKQQYQSLPSPQPTAAVALYAMCLRETADTAGYDQALKELASRTADADARTWHTLLVTTVPDLKLVQTLRDALLRDPTNGIFYLWLGSSLNNLGELDQACIAWDTSARLMPGWALPPLEKSRALLAAGRASEAADAATLAAIRAPRLGAVIVQQIATRHAVLSLQADPKQTAELLNITEQARAIAPRDPTLLPIHVDLLARSGKSDEAADIARAYLSDTSKAVAPSTALQLLDLARRYQLTLDVASLQSSDPSLVLRRAIELGESKGIDAARDLLTQAAGTNQQTPTWRRAFARLEVALNAPTAAATCRALGDAFPSDLSVQSDVLDLARSALSSDRVLMSTTLDRLKALLGEESSRWQLERARFLLASASDDDAREAGGIAMKLVRDQPSNAPARLVLARSILRTGTSTANAIEHLRFASTASPADSEIAMELVRALSAVGRDGEARTVLAKHAEYRPATPQARQVIVQALLDRGMHREALQLLDSNRTELAAAEFTTMAQLLAVLNQTDRAGEVFASVLKNNPVPSSIAAAALFYRETNQTAPLADALKQLDDSQPALDRELARSRYLLAAGEIAPAREAMKRALELGNDQAAVWQLAIALENAAGNYPAALYLATQAAAKFPADADLARSLAQSKALASGDNQSIDQLIAALQSDPDRAEQVALLKLQKQASESGQPSVELARAMAKYSEKYPTAIALQQRAIELCLRVALSDQAALIARRTAELLPASAPAQRLAALTFHSLDQAPASRQYAVRWKQLDAASALDVDTLLGDLSLGDGQPAQALKHVEPYRAVALQKPDAHRATLVVLARAIASAESLEKSTAMLEPMLPASAAARSALLSALSTATDANQAGAAMTKLISATPQPAEAEWYAITVNALGAGERGLDAALLPLVQPIASRFASKADSSPHWLLVNAEVCRRSKDFAGAEKSLRDALVRQPGLADAQNLLAYVLIEQQKQLPEAIALADAATKSAPDRPSFFDTLARAQLLTGDLDSADRAFRAALNLDANHLDALVGLASLQLKRDQKSAAQETLTRIDRLVSADQSKAGRVPSHLSGELNSLREALSNAKD